jgi:hypothetical protein
MLAVWSIILAIVTGSSICGHTLLISYQISREPIRESHISWYKLQMQAFGQPSSKDVHESKLYGD